MFKNKKLHYGVLCFIFFLAFFLRFYKFTQDPPGLYLDEVANGIDAYSILTTGRDHFGNKPYPLWFESFGDYKMPLYVYAVSGAMAVFGKNEFSVRFPSALSGSLTVVLFYFFASTLVELERKKIPKNFEYLPILSTFLLAISSWHIQFSRGGFEVTLATFFFLLATWLVLLYIKSKKFRWMFFAFLLYVLSIYTYQTFRITAPIILTFLSIYLFIKESKIRKEIIITAAISFALLLPLIIFSFTPEGQSRFAETSAFVEFTAPNLLDKLSLYPLVYLRNYFSFFSFDFLFSFGDGIGRHQIVDFGELARWQIPFLLAGIYFFLKSRKTFFSKVIIALLLLPPVAAAIARPSPHALRSLPMVLPFMIIISVGLLYLLPKLKQWTIYGILAVILITGYSFATYINFYYIEYPSVNVLDWGGGYKQLVEQTTKIQNKFSHIVIDPNLTNTALYFYFYNPKLNVQTVDKNWVKPVAWKNQSVLLIRPYYGQKTGKSIIENVYLQNVNHDVFAQLWKI